MSDAVDSVSVAPSFWIIRANPASSLWRCSSFRLRSILDSAMWRSCDPNMYQGFSKGVVCVI